MKEEIPNQIPTSLQIGSSSTGREDESESVSENFHGKNNEAELGTSNYRITKLRNLMNNLISRLKIYFELETVPYNKNKSTDIKKVDDEISSIFNQAERLLSRMEDFQLTEEDIEIVLNLLDQVENLQSAWLDATNRYQEAQDRRSKINQFTSSFEEKTKEIISNLDKLPSGKKSSLKFEGGHYVKLLKVLNQKDIEAVRDIILELDRLLTDDYTIIPKKLIGGATLRFRLEQALQKPSYPQTFNYKRIELSKGVLVITTSQEKVAVSLEGLDEDQQEIWEKIK